MASNPSRRKLMEFSLIGACCPSAVGSLSGSILFLYGTRTIPSITQPGNLQTVDHARGQQTSATFVESPTDEAGSSPEMAECKIYFSGFLYFL